MFGLAQMTQYRQDAQFDPTNPNQRQYMQYAQIPGGYGSYYTTQVPAESSLQGALGFPITRQLNGVSETWNSIPAFVQTGLVLALGTAAGYFGWRKYGATIKSKTGLGGARRRRR